MNVMKSFLRFFNNLPFLPKILLLFFLGILLVAAFKRGSGAFQGMDWLFTLTSVLWLIAILGVLHVAGYLGPVSRWPVIGPGLNWLTNRSPGEKPTSSVKHSPEECKHNAIEQMKRLQGIDQVLEELQRSQNSLLRDNRNRPGVILWLTGPRGTGKSTLADTLGCYFRGHGAIQDDKVRKFVWNDLQQKGLDSLDEFARLSLDGILILDGADWLVDDKNPVGIQAGAALDQIAADYPQRLTLVVTCKSETYRRLKNDPQHKKMWLDHFTQYEIEFPSLSDEILLNLIRSGAAAKRLNIEENEEATGTLRRWLRKTREREGQDERNAYIAFDIVDDIDKETPAVSIQAPPPSTGVGSTNQPPPIRVVGAERLKTIAAKALGLPLSS